MGRSCGIDGVHNYLEREFINAFSLKTDLHHPQITLQSGLPFCLSRRGQRNAQTEAGNGGAAPNADAAASTAAANPNQQTSGWHRH